MKKDLVEELELFEGPGEGIELAIPGDMIRWRHIATRASNRRAIVVLVLEDAEFEGYCIGIDKHSLQLLDIASGEVSSIALEYIVSITDGKTFDKLTPAEMGVVDRRTASFRKTSDNWLRSNWPGVYDRKDGEDSHRQQRTYPRPPYVARYGQTDHEGRTSSHDNPEVRHGAGEDRGEA